MTNRHKVIKSEKQSSFLAHPVYHREHTGTVGRRKVRYDHTVSYSGLQVKKIGQQNEQAWYYETNMFAYNSFVLSVFQIVYCVLLVPVLTHCLRLPSNINNLLTYLHTPI